MNKKNWKKKLKKKKNRKKFKKIKNQEKMLLNLKKPGKRNKYYFKEG